MCASLLNSFRQSLKQSRYPVLANYSASDSFMWPMALCKCFTYFLLMLWVLSCNFNSRLSHKLTNTHATARLFTISHSVTACSSPNSVTSVLDRLTVGPKRAAAAKDLLPAPDLSNKPAGVSCCCRSTKQKDGRILDRFMTLVACYADRVAIFCIC